MAAQWKDGYEGGRWKGKHLFVSSTFQDMQTERDSLRDDVQPELQRRLRNRRHHLEMVDLRLGIDTGDDPDRVQHELTMLWLCLSEIDRCQPYFIAFIGSRYGTVPGRELTDAVAIRAGIEPPRDAISITELEIRHALLRYGSLESPRIWIYIRDDRDSQDGSRRTSGAGSDGARTASDLRDWIQLHFQSTHPSRVRPYPPITNSDGRAAFAEMVITDLWADLDRDTHDFPQLTKDRVGWELECFAEEKLVSYVPPAKAIAEVSHFLFDRQIRMNQFGLGICADKGSGKSSLIAYLYRHVVMLSTDHHNTWWKSLSAKTPARVGLVLAHSTQMGTPCARSADAMVRRWIDQLQLFLRTTAGGHELHGHQIYERFANLLLEASKDHLVVILVDAIEGFGDEGPAADVTLPWIPPKVSPNTRIVVTGRECAALHFFMQRGGRVSRSIVALSGDEGKSLVKSVFAKYHRMVKDSVLAMMFPGNRLSRYPADWVKLVAEDLNYVDSRRFESVLRRDPTAYGEQLQELSLLDRVTDVPRDVENAARWIANNLRVDDAFDAEMVDVFICTFACVPNGWTSDDAAGILCRALGKTVSPLAFNRLRRAMAPLISEKGSGAALDFVSSAIRQALLDVINVAAHALRIVLRATALHLLHAPEDNPSRRLLLMRFLLEVGDVQMLVKYITDEPTFCHGTDMQTILDYLCGSPLFDWHPLASTITDKELAARDGLLRRMLEASASCIETWGAVSSVGLKLLQISYHGIDLTRRRTLATALAAKALSVATEAHGAPMSVQRIVSVACNEAGDACSESNAIDEALAYYQRSLSAAERLRSYDPANELFMDDLSVTLLNLAQAHLSRASTKEALPLLERAVAIRRNLAAAHPDDSESHRRLSLALRAEGGVRDASGDVDGCRDRIEEALQVLARHHDPTSGDISFHVEWFTCQLSLKRWQLTYGHISEETLTSTEAIEEAIQKLVHQNPFVVRLLLLLLESELLLAEICCRVRGRDAAQPVYAKAKAIAHMLHTVDSTHPELNAQCAALVELGKRCGIE